VLGTINPVRQIADAAHAVGAVVLVDGAQSVPHMPTRVEELGCDFLVFSGHKMCGPTGIGVLWGREELLESMPAFLGGGEMILDVRLDGWLPNGLPLKFEAGTPPIAEAVGLGAAVGPAEPADRGGVMSFTYNGIHPHDISQVLDQSGVCVRAGHHCAKPLMRRLGVGATARASFYVYNDEADVDSLADALVAASDLFAPA